MRKILLALVAAIVSVFVFASSAMASTVTWWDDFKKLDTTHWTAQHTYIAEDDTCYVPEAVTLAHGYLTETVRRAPKTQCWSVTRNYTGAYLNSKGKFSFAVPGKTIDIRAKINLPKGTSKGLWPGLWLRPDDGGIGELDLFEAIGTSKASTGEYGLFHSTIHYDYKGTHPQVAQAYRYDPTVFHVWTLAVAKDGSSVSIGMDGKVMGTLKASWSKEAFGSARPFHLRITVGAGKAGTWSGAPDADTAFPATPIVVDYVKVHAR